MSFIVSLVIVLATNACHSGISSKSELRDYIHKSGNGLFKVLHFPNGVQVGLQYMPAELLSKKLNVIDKFFFILSFSMQGKELLGQLDPNTYSEMVQVFSFRMLPYINMRNGNKVSIQAMDCFFQQTFGMTGANELLVVFDARKIRGRKDLKIVVGEFGLNLGDMNFDFAVKDIDEIKNIVDKNLQ